MAGANLWVGVGNLTADPEMRYTESGKAVCSFSIACNETWGQGSEKKERVEFVRLVFWEGLAEVCGKYLKKGQPIYVQGRLQTRSWEDKGGSKRYVSEIVGNVMQMLGNKPQQQTKSEPEQENIPF